MCGRCIRYIKEPESDPSSSEDAVEVVVPSDKFVIWSTRFYEIQSNGAGRFTSGNDRHFSDAEICLDVVMTMLVI
jgi:hypothetical protein